MASQDFLKHPLERLNVILPPPCLPRILVLYLLHWSNISLIHTQAHMTVTGFTANLGAMVGLTEIQAKLLLWVMFAIFLLPLAVLLGPLCSVSPSSLLSVLLQPLWR